MNLIVDIGNTLVKVAVFDGGRIVAQRCVERLHPSMLGELLEGRRAAKAVVASTRGEADDVIETVRPYADYLLEFTSQTPVPVANAYHTPETLGRDRWAAAVGATVLYPGRNVLIVDDMIDTAGTICMAADMLMSRGAKSVRAAITHPVLSGPAYERINESALEEVIVTDTIPLNPNKDLHKFTVLSVADLFADVIERVHNYKEISSIFSK